MNSLKTGITFSLFLIFNTLISIAQPNKKTAPKPSPNSPEQLFLNPPESAKPGVLWMWMGANVSKQGITKDLEALKEEGFNSTTMLGLADITNPWGSPIDKGLTPEVIAWTEPWWKLVKHAAEESKRLKMTMGLFNGAGYATSGGVWITPELSMQQICWSQKTVKGKKGQQEINLDKPKVDIHANARFPKYNPKNGKIEIPEIPERKTYYKDIAVLAMPAKDTVLKKNIIDLTPLMTPDGKLQWDAPEGDWVVYRFGHTTLGEQVQPAQWQATGLECDKMSREAVEFHMDHVIGEIKSHLGDLVGKTIDHVYFDSYEENDATWTPKMREQFSSRRGYDLLPYLAVFAGRTIEGREQTDRFRQDFSATVQDLYRDVYFTTIAKKLKAVNLKFLCEAYGGPWRTDDVLPLVSNVMGEFWTHDGIYSPYELENVITSLRRSNQNILAAEALTGQPADSKWNETPAWLKPVADEAFCAGVNKIIVHRFVQQPWDDKYLPGATMGQWGTHFDRTQTWWKPAKAIVHYWQRCEAVLQWGRYVPNSLNDFGLQLSNMDMVIKNIHRKENNTDIYFVANTSHYPGQANCTFNVAGLQPELWDPVSGTIRDLNQFTQKNGKTSITLSFEDAQSFFIVFRKKILNVGLVHKPNFIASKSVLDLDGPWMVKFDALWGGPATPVKFETLTDWSKSSDKGIKYYSGTAVYSKSFTIPAADLVKLNHVVYLDLGTVNCIAKVFVNNKEAGIVWTAPWRIGIPSALLKSTNELKIEVTNVWANRLIGDEQEPSDMKWLPNQYIYNSGQYLKEFPDWFINNTPRPSKGRYCFTTWNYFDSHSKLASSGLLGPVKIEEDEF
ncbi:glycosyl hydrolase [Mucilaginibacter sp. OK098]|uniref:glycosyl hydrolase n=1 Tax=Mucilaginibacter sp. OK098 TaxID=1855297 RepID=UPI0009109728|nr:glycosyl hydrolase [Mucilaginibacter sp. OK098]SHM90739.1 Glycosyl hydrolases family 2, sugar binding domain [Mucilaginibacter sp. OK098]